MTPEILIAIVSLLTTLALGFYAIFWVPRRVENTFYELKDELIEWFATEKGMVFVATLGKLFGTGAMSSVKFGAGKSKSIDIMGFKIPQSWVESFINPLVESQVKKWVPEIGQT